jgi:hypothetical protein
MTIKNIFLLCHIMGVKIVIMSGGVIRQIHVGVIKMKQRFICTVLVLVLVLSVCSSSLASPISIMQAQGDCAISNNGKNVIYSGNASSGQIEDIISVTLRLMENRNGTWYEVNRAYKSLTTAAFVQTSGNFAVTGGYYYKVIGTYYSKTGSQAYTTESQTASVWIAR